MKQTLTEAINELHDFMNPDNSEDPDELTMRDPLVHGFDYFGQPCTFEWRDNGSYNEPFASRKVKVAVYLCLPSNLEDADSVYVNSEYGDKPQSYIFARAVRHSVSNLFKRRLTHNNPELTGNPEFMVDGRHADEEFCTRMQDANSSVFDNELTGRVFGADVSVQIIDDQAEYVFSDERRYTQTIASSTLGGKAVDYHYFGSDEPYDLHLAQMAAKIVTPGNISRTSDELTVYR